MLKNKLCKRKAAICGLQIKGRNMHVMTMLSSYAILTAIYSHAVAITHEVILAYAFAA